MVLFAISRLYRDIILLSFWAMDRSFIGFLNFRTNVQTKGHSFGTGHRPSLDRAVGGDGGPLAALLWGRRITASHGVLSGPHRSLWAGRATLHLVHCTAVMARQRGSPFHVTW